MKIITRRGFLGKIGLIVPGIALLKFARGLTPSPFTSVQVKYASAFSGPFITEQLKPASVFDVQWKSGKAYLTTGKYMLGWLPEHVAQNYRSARFKGENPGVYLDRIRRDEQGRLLLFVNVTHVG